MGGLGVLILLQPKDQEHKQIAEGTDVPSPLGTDGFILLKRFHHNELMIYSQTTKR